MIAATRRSVVIFDLGGVLLDWNPRYLYRKLIADEAACETFLTEVCPPEWNVAQDAGRSFAEAEAEAIARHPDKAELIRAWLRRFDEMIPTAIREPSTFWSACTPAVSRSTHSPTSRARPSARRARDSVLRSLQGHRRLRRREDAEARGADLSAALRSLRRRPERSRIHRRFSEER